MTLRFHAAGICLALALPCLGSPQTILQEPFESYAHARSLFGDTTAYKLRTDTFGRAALFSSTDSARSTEIDVELPADSLRGSKVVFSAWTRGRNLTKKPDPWNGVKVMLVAEDSLGQRTYPQLQWPEDVSGWDWQRQWSVVSLPQNLKSATLVVGLELTAGSLWVDSLKVVRVAQGIAPPRSSNLPIPNFSPTRLRGAMIGTSTVDSQAIARFGKTWKGNLLRWQLNQPWPRDSGLIDSRFNADLQEEMAKLDRALEICRKAGIKVVVDMHGLSQHLFHDQAAQTRLVETWKTLATRYHQHPAVWGWDLANEPNEAEWSEGLLFWDELADTIAREIRRIDTQKVIIVEPASGGGVTELPNLKPLGWNRGYDIPKVVYSFHFYSPGEITGQGELPENPVGPVYPGTLLGETWDSTRMRQALTPAYEFQRKYRVPLYVGEFSCIRWAPKKSALHWLTDFTRLLEEAGWDWSYHAYQEYHGWSVEYSDSLGDMRTPLETDRKALLLSLFSHNEDPYKTTSTAPAPGAPASPRFRRVGASIVLLEGLAADSRPSLWSPRGQKLELHPLGNGSYSIHCDRPGLWLYREGRGPTSIRSVVFLP